MSDWCPENDGAYRDEQNAIFTQKVLNMMESYYGLEVAIGELLKHTTEKPSSQCGMTRIIRAIYSSDQEEILYQALHEVKKSMTQMCEEKLSKL